MNVKRTRMANCLTALGAAAIFGALATAARAQDRPRYNPDITRGEVASFDRYLDRHPEVARELAARPELVNDPHFLASHPGFRGFMAGHPGVREEIHESPGRLMYRERRYEWSRGQAHPLATTDRYLDGHPRTAGQLERHPGLVDDPGYVASHPGLHEYVASHPVARADWETHPYRYMNREGKYDRTH